MKSGTEELTELRNERKPCHFWVDNEVADCYQAIVGADAIWVYCRIARYANGAWIVSPRLRGTNDTRVSLREMAEWCGKSRDTVWRALEVLEAVGLLHSVRGAEKAKGRYALSDVKDLVLREGGAYDRGTGSFQLPAERVVELKEMVRLLLVKMTRKGGARLTVIEAAEPPVEAAGAPESAESQSVAQSDRLEGELFGASVAQSDTTVALEGQICRSGGPDASRYIYKNLKTTRKSLSGGKRQRDAAERRIPDPRHAPFKTALGEYWRSKNPTLEMPWDGSEARALGEFLRASPAMALEVFVGCLRGRFKSDVNHGDRPRVWIGSLTSYLTPIDRFKIPKGENKHGTGQRSATHERVKAGRISLAETAVARGWITVDEIAGGADQAVSEPGPGGFDSGVRGGLRSVDGEVLDRTG